VDESFLESLIVNANLRERNYWQVVCDTTFLTQQLATVASSVSVTYLLYQASLLSTFQCRCGGQLTVQVQHGLPRVSFVLTSCNVSRPEASQTLQAHHLPTAEYIAC
jgi:hypothetical protein